MTWLSKLKFPVTETAVPSGVPGGDQQLILPFAQSHLKSGERECDQCFPPARVCQKLSLNPTSMSSGGPKLNKSTWSLGKL